MEIIETKEVIKTQIEKVRVGRKCDICGKAIEKQENLHDQYNYFVIHTWHNDWGKRQH